MMAAGEIVSEFVREQNRKQREREGQAADERERMPVEQRKRAQEFVEGDGFILGVGRGEVRAGHEAGAQRDEEQVR